MEDWMSSNVEHDHMRIVSKVNLKDQVSGKPLPIPEFIKRISDYVQHNITWSPRAIGVGAVVCLFAWVAYHEISKRWNKQPNLPGKEKSTHIEEGEKVQEESESHQEEDSIEEFLARAEEDPADLLLNTLINILTGEEDLAKPAESALLASELPSVGLQDVLITPVKGSRAVISTSPAGQRLRVRDLVLDVQKKSQELREKEMELETKIRDIDTLTSEVDDAERRFEKVDELRKHAESERDLVHTELLKLQHLEAHRQQECEEYRQKIRQLEQKLLLFNSSTSGDLSGVQKTLDEIRRDQEKAKTETLRLRDTNKVLTQKAAEDKINRERLLKQVDELKKRLKQQPGNDDLEAYGEPDHAENNIWGYKPPSPGTWRTRQTQQTLSDNESDSGTSTVMNDAESELSQSSRSTTGKFREAGAPHRVDYASAYANLLSSQTRYQHHDADDSEEIPDRESFVQKEW